jgi:hypothetical protein
MAKMGSLIRTTALVLVAALGVASLVGTGRPPGNPDAPLLAGAQVSPEVRGLIDRACRDCHSDATRYPWYSSVAPVSFLINRDIRLGRERLNFSKWSEYSVTRRERYLSEIANQVQDRGMPLAIYTFMHRDARLSQSEIDALFTWTQAERTRLIEWVQASPPVPGERSSPATPIH